MEKKFIALFFIMWVFFAAGCAGQTGGGTSFKKPLTAKSRIFIASDSVLSHALTGEFIKRGYTVVTWNDLDKALAGKEATPPGLSEQDLLVHGGKILHADVVLAIKMIPFSWDDYKVYTAFIKLFETERGDIVGSITYQNGASWISRESLPGSAERIAKLLFEGAE